MSRQVSQYLRLFGRWWWLLVISAVIPAVITTVLLSRQPDTYQAKATLVVGTTLQNPEPDQWQMNVANTLANAYARLAKQEPVIQAVMDRLGLERRADQLVEQISTRVYQDAQLLEIEVVDTDPRAAALIANALADELVRRSPISQEDQARRQAFIHAQLDDLESRIEQLDQQINELQASLVELTSAAELAEAQSRLNQSETSKAGLQATYASLLNSYQTETPNVVSVFDPAVEPTTALPRNDILVTAVGAVAGLALALAGVLLIEYLDDRVRWEEDTRMSLLDMPVLGAVPRMPSKEGSIAEAIEPLSPSAEMVRSLRTSIFLAVDEQPSRTLAFTSPTLMDGKTFVVAQLGLAIAAGGKRVVLVDGDLRKPTMHELFDLPNVYGLSELLAGRDRLAASSWPKGTQQTGVENLHLLPGGKPPLDPTVLLTSPRLRKLLDALEKQADVILVDTPPELVAPDAAVLAAATDGTILVVNAGKTSRRQIQRVKERLTGRDGVNLLGVAFNSVKVDGDSYYRTRRTRRGAGFLRRLRAILPFVGEGVPAEDGHSVLNLGEMAFTLGVSRATARRWCKSGRLPAHRSRLGWRIKEKDLHEAILHLTHDADT